MHCRLSCDDTLRSVISTIIKLHTVKSEGVRQIWECFLVMPDMDGERIGLNLIRESQLISSNDEWLWSGGISDVATRLLQPLVDKASGV